MQGTILVAVFDTNELVRIALAQTTEILEMWQAALDGRFELVVSEKILAELERVLGYKRITRKYQITRADVQDFLEMLKTAGFFAQDLYEVSFVKDDPTDNIFLAVALEAEADYVVSEDPHLRNIKYYHGVQIIGLTDFQKILGL
jgi:putative PIN family toxin of toxin-antitoxin system